MKTMTLKHKAMASVGLLAALTAVVVGGGAPPDDAACCETLSSGGVVMADGAAMILGLPVAGVSSSADHRAHFGVVHCWSAGGGPPPCPGNLNGDGVVDAADLAILLGSWGPCPGCDADLNGDDVVDAADLAQLLGGWGPCL